MGSATDREAMAEVEKRNKRIKAQLNVDLRLLKERPEFLRFYGFLLSICDPMAPAFNTNGSLENYLLGRQEVGKELWNLIEEVQPDSAVSVRRAWKALTEEKNDD